MLSAIASNSSRRAERLAYLRLNLALLIRQPFQ
jgi:hypothetical protein